MKLLKYLRNILKRNCCRYCTHCGKRDERFVENIGNPYCWLKWEEVKYTSTCADWEQR